MADSTLKTALRDGTFVVAPGVFDMISARVADGIGFIALYATGFGTVASHLGIADAGIATYSDMVSRVGRFAQSCTTPVIADADTGYGGLLNVRHTVMGYEAAGIAAIQIEDQEVPKKCGHTPGRRVIPAHEMCLKIEVAVEARRSTDFLIVARTDARRRWALMRQSPAATPMRAPAPTWCSSKAPRRKTKWSGLVRRSMRRCSPTWLRADARRSCRPHG
jgi:2-methylisocitrate lyase-like PEP mutase family enzyme